jgi:hypothetical protein
MVATKTNENFNRGSHPFNTYIFLHIVIKVALFYTQNRSETSTFLHEKS